MNCKYCGAALPTSGGVCPGCGRMIPISQQKEMKEMLDPRWNQYRNKDSVFYNSISNNDSYSKKKTNKPLLFILVIVLVIILIMVLKGLG